MKSKPDRFKTVPPRGSTYTSVKVSEPESRERVMDLPNTIKCFDCSGPHGVLSCPEYKRKSVGERRDLIMKKRLCFNCLSPKHASRGCWKSRQCQVKGCDDPRKHHTTLHTNKQEGDGKTTRSSESVAGGVVNAEVHMQSGNNCREEVYFQVLPVVIKGSNGQTLKTHAVLDGASDICPHTFGKSILSSPSNEPTFKLTSRAFICFVPPRVFTVRSCSSPVIPIFSSS